MKMKTENTKVKFKKIVEWKIPDRNDMIYEFWPGLIICIFLIISSIIILFNYPFEILQFRDRDVLVGLFLFLQFIVIVIFIYFLWDFRPKREIYYVKK